MALTLISATGCSHQNDNSKQDYSSNSYVSNYYDNQNVIIKGELEERSIVSETAEPEVVESSIYESSIYDVISSQKVLESSEKVSEESKKKFSKEAFITFLENLDDKITDKLEDIAHDVVDGCKVAYNFVFNGGTIKGYTLDELEDAMQQKAITLIAKIDNKIDNYLPNYKENIKISFGNTKDKIVDLAEKYGEKFKNKIIDIIGEEKYESYVSVAEELNSISNDILHDDIDSLKDAWGYLKDKAKGLVKKKS